MDPQRILIDTERVIAEVRKRPQIWQPKNVHYKSRDARQHAWSHISRILVPTLGDLSRADQNEIEKKIQQRWRTARDSFVKSRAQQLENGANGRERNYGYYDMLKFLEPTLRPPLKAQLAMASSTPPPPTPSPPTPSPPPAELRRRRRLRVAARAPVQRPRRHTPLEEDDDNFFRSLAPMLRALRTEQKLSFRSRVLALALQVQAEPMHYLELQPPDSRYHDELDGDEDALETKYRPFSPDSPHSDNGEDTTKS